MSENATCERDLCLARRRWMGGDVASMRRHSGRSQGEGPWLRLQLLTNAYY